MSAIEVRDLSVSYEKLIVIDNLNVSIPKGKITIIVGANGSGKSTLLKTIARIIKPLSGMILLNNNNIRKQPGKHIAKQVAYLPQNPKAPSGLLVKELIAYGRFPYQKAIGGLNNHDLEIINWALEETDLTHLADRPIDNLSGGQRQRAWIAMVLAQETDILLLDEPTTYLDISYQLEVLNLLQKLNQEKQKTVVMVLHELNNACRFADNLIGVSNGKIAFQGSPLEVITKENLKKIYGINAKIALSENGNYPICIEYDN